jgi:thiamine biosynthesis lipoprotein
MGTVFSFAWRQPPTAETVRSVECELMRIDGVFSIYRPDSEISALAAGRVGVADCSPDLREVLDLCRQAERLTAGYFSTRPAGRVDPTGLVKGWAVRRAADLLSAAGSSCHVVNGGGDVLVVADPVTDLPWRVGVSADRPRSVMATVIGHNVAVATSGNIERPGEIVNPYTGRRAMALRSVTVIGPDIVEADAFATAAVAMENRALAWLEGLPGYEAVVLTADGRLSTTSGARTYLAAGVDEELHPRWSSADWSEVR